MGASRKESGHQFNLTRRKSIAGIFFVIIVSSVIIVIGQIPVHRTNIQHSDMIGDVSNANIDIVLVKSFLNGSNVSLEMTVAGRIMNSTVNERYEYRLIVVAKGLVDTKAHVYTCYYDNGSTWPYSLRSFSKNDTLTILFPIATFISDSYMIGLEGVASVSSSIEIERDYTPEDRNGTIARILF